MNQKDQFFLQKAIQLALHGMNSGAGGPFGAVIVKDGKIVGEGWNSVTSTNDPTAHAEVVAIRNACKNLGDFQLKDCTIYSSCEPCPMCLGAIYWARPKRLVFAASHEDAAKAGFDDSFIYEEMAVPVKDRKIPVVQMMRKEGWQPFGVWLEKEDREDY